MRAADMGQLIGNKLIGKLSIVACCDVNLRFIFSQIHTRNGSKRGVCRMGFSSLLQSNDGLHHTKKTADYHWEALPVPKESKQDL